MNGATLINLLADAGVIRPDVTRINIIAFSDGHLTISTEYIPGEVDEDDLDRLRQIAQLAAKMVKLQLEDGQVDDRLAEQVQALING